MSGDPYVNELEERLGELMYEVDQKIDASAKQVYDSVQRQTEANERLIAELMMGYQELTTVVQVLIHKLWGSDIEETADFKRKLEKERKLMMEWIRNGATAMATDKQDVADALEQLFAIEPSNADG